ncbi:MAG: DUF4271 domain-containing protein [Bacteroidota bacterium]
MDQLFLPPMWGNYNIRFVYIILFLGLPWLLAAQQAETNPFEIKSRLKKQESPVETKESGNPFEIKRPESTSTDSTTSPTTTANPFEVNQTSPTTSSPQTEESNPFEVGGTTAAPPAPPSNQENPFDLKSPASPVEPAIAPPPPTDLGNSPISDEVLLFDDSNFIFWLILFMLFLLTLLVSLFRQYIAKAYRAFTNDNFLKLIHREQGRIIDWPYLSLYIGFILNAGIFALLVWKYYGLIGGGNMIYLFRFIAAVAAIFITKHLLLGIVAGVFPVEKEIRQYSFMIVIFNIVLGILLVPINISLAYGPASLHTVVLYGAFLIIFLVYLFRVFRSLFLASRYIGLHKFHFFMYLCTVEIAPVLVLTKFIMLEAGIQ